MKKSLLAVACCLTAFVHGQIKPDTTTRPLVLTSTLKPVPAAYESGILLNYIRTWTPSAPFSSIVQVKDSVRTTAEVKQITQYFDGLGRPIQTVGKRISGAGRDMVSPFIYDSLGRETFKYLPYVQQTSNTTDGKFKTDPFNAQAAFFGNSTLNPGVIGEQVFYSRTALEYSPLNRLDSSFNPGNSWAGSNKGMILQNGTNADIDSVRIWDIADQAGSLPITNGTYAAGTLYKTITVDEHGNQVVEYADKEGQIILKKVQLDAAPSSHHNGWLCTYYVFDDLNLLRFVISPKAVEAIAGAWTITTNISDELCFRYEYDPRKRVILKKVPGSGEIQMVYDARDRLIMTQDSNLDGGQWLVMKYDGLNRHLQTYLWTNNQDRVSHAVAAQASTIYPILSGTYELLVENFYDDYNWVPEASGVSSVLNTEYTNSSDYINTYNTAPLFAQEVEANFLLKGSLTGTKTRVMGSDKFLYTAMFFDAKGRPIQIQSTNISGETDVRTLQFDFSGKVLKNHLSHNFPANGQTFSVLTSHAYDHVGRLLSIKKKINEEEEKTTSVLSYDELGQLKAKKLGKCPQNEDPLETLDYTYNIRGWLTGINRGFANPNFSSEANAQGNRWFGMQLSYDFGFKEGNSRVSLLNGNISGTQWKSKGDLKQRSYGFFYDPSNRLMRADNSSFEGSQWLNGNFSVRMGNGINPTTAYDANGNILRMTQRGIKGISPDIIDSLQYTYYPNSNKLKSVADYNNDANSKIGDFKSGLNHPQFAWKDDITGYLANAGDLNNLVDYNYDSNGNLRYDKNKGISAIHYNHLNLPDSVAFETVNNDPIGYILFRYDAAGNKLMKIIHEVSDGDTAFKESISTYIGDFVYDSIVTKLVTDEDIPSANKLVLFGHEEGRIRERWIDSSKTKEYQFDYFIKDHLGNVRMILTEEQQTDLYPPASTEPSNADIEDQLYNKVSESRVPLPAGYPTDNYTIPNEYVSKVQGDGYVIGPNKVLKVMAGDRVNIRVSSWYRLNGNSTGNLSNSYLESLLLTLADNASVLSSGKATWAEIYSNGLYPYEEFIQKREEAGPPYAKAFLNWIMFDEEFQNIIGSSGFDPVGNDDEFKEHIVNDLEIPKNGYLFVFVSNEEIDIPVYFDNLQVTHIRGPLLEENHYYPFGLIQEGISSKAISFGDPENKYKFNQGTELNKAEFSNGTGLELYSTDFRNYDPQIGRFLIIDPLCEFAARFSPYTYCYNNPISFNDPTGLMGDTIRTNTPNETPGFNGNIKTEEGVVVSYKGKKKKPGLTSRNSTSKPYGEIVEIALDRNKSRYTKLKELHDLPKPHGVAADLNDGKLLRNILAGAILDLADKAFTAVDIVAALLSVTEQGRTPLQIPVIGALFDPFIQQEQKSDVELALRAFKQGYTTAVDVMNSGVGRRLNMRGYFVTSETLLKFLSEGIKSTDGVISTSRPGSFPYSAPDNATFLIIFPASSSDVIVNFGIIPIPQKK